MNSSAILTLIREGSDREISDLSYQLLHIEDMEQLKELSLAVPQIESFTVVNKGQKSQYSENRQESLGRIISRLGGIARGQCNCNKYLICMYFPYSEQERGGIRILIDEASQETYESYFECECVICHGRFQVRESEAGFGRRAVWTQHI